MVIFIVLEKNKVLLIIADPDPISAWLLEFLFFGERNRLCSCKIDNNNNKCFESRLWVINKRERERERETESKCSYKEEITCLNKWTNWQQAFFASSIIFFYL